MPAAVQKLSDPAQRIPLGRVGHPEELANLAAFLLSDYSAYINGDCITIDGGEWLRNAGEFNFLDAISPAEWDELQAQLKPKKQ
jgi:NAD(P)-dependent dehydrogenase (short-subunit alcohol dehydrogenase family)